MGSIEKHLLSLACVMAVILLAAQDCQARRWETSLMAGYTVGGRFDEEAEDGGEDPDTLLNIREGPSFALALNTEWEHGTELELYYSRQSTKLEIDDGAFSGDTLFDLDIHYLHIGGTVILTQVKDVFGETLFKPDGFCEPYIVGTFGVTHFVPRDSAYDPATRLSVALGFGTRLRATDRFGFRLEARGFATLFGGSGAVFSGPEGMRIYVASEAIGQVVLNAGVYYDF
jgi:hypothetical protein